MDSEKQRFDAENEEEEEEEEEELCLKWHDHHLTFFSRAEQLCAAQKLTDVTLSCGSKQYAAHKLVLSICSGYFSNLFASTFRNDSRAVAIVYMRDVSPKHMELLLTYMYRGEVQVPEHDLSEFLETAKGLRIRGLTCDLDIPPPKRGRPSKTAFQLQSSSSSSTDGHRPKSSKQAKRKRKNSNVFIRGDETTEVVVVNEEGIILDEKKTQKQLEPGEVIDDENDFMDQNYDDKMYDAGGKNAFIGEPLDNEQPQGEITEKQIYDIEFDAALGGLPCPVCKKPFSKRYELTRHMITHSDRISYSCTLCYRVFKRRDHGLSHARNKHPELDKSARTAAITKVF